MEDKQESEGLHETGAGLNAGSVPGNAPGAALGGEVSEETEEIEVNVQSVEIVESVVSVESASEENAESEESVENVQTEIVENASAVEVQVRDTDQVAVEEADHGSPTAGAVIEAGPRVALSGSGQSPGTGRPANAGMSRSVNPVLQELHSEQQPRCTCNLTVFLNQRRKLRQSRERMNQYPGWMTLPSPKPQLLRAQCGSLGTGTDRTRPMNQRTHQKWMQHPGKSRSQDPMINHHDRKPCRRRNR